MIGKADYSVAEPPTGSAAELYFGLQNYWLSYYKIRKLTLHDFETGVSLSNEFEYKYGL